MAEKPPHSGNTTATATTTNNPTRPEINRDSPATDRSDRNPASSTRASSATMNYFQPRVPTGYYFSNVASFDFSAINQEQQQQQQAFSYQQFESVEWRSWSSSSYRPRRLPAHRKWQVTEFGRAWYEKFKQPDKMRKTNSSAATAASTSSDFKFKLATYNLLAPNLLEDNYYLYDRISHDFLDWEFRKRKLFEQIQREHSDIWCFQEMDENQYFQFFLPKLTELGYSCFFKKRLGEKRDGCALCFSTRKFELVKLDQVEFNVPGVEILNRENVGLIALLKAKPRVNSDKYLCVATTHLLYNPKRGDCKLAQIQLLLAHLDRMAHRGNDDDGGGVPDTATKSNNKNLYHPVILCGDLNLTTDSPLYRYLSTAKLANYKQLNSYLLSGQLEDPALTRLIETAILPESLGITDQSQFKADVDSRSTTNTSYTFGEADLSHAFRFRSVYDHRDQHGSPEVTTCTRGTKRTVDYIFFHSAPHETDRNEKPPQTPPPPPQQQQQQQQRKRVSSESAEKSETSGLELIARLQLFTKSLVPDYSMPEPNYPSDHFILAAKFLLT